MTELQTLEAEILGLQDRLNLRPPLDIVREMGTRLLRAKDLVGHGKWQSWLARMGLRPRTAQTYMQVAKTPSPAYLPERLSVDGFLRMIRVAKRAARREDLRQQDGEAPADDPDCEVVRADCRAYEWPDEIEVIATDPPWGDLDAYGWLAGFAGGHLTEGGLLLVQCGVAGLCDVLDVMRKAGLTYQHTLSITYAHSSGGSLLHPFQSNWRPVVVLTKGPFNRKGTRVFSDVVTVSSSPKQYHSWEQPLKPWAYWLERLTRPAQLVVDPYAGSATIGLACKQLGRRYLGTEIDPAHVQTAKSRIAGMN